jgi:hypothetical protein
MLELAPLDDKEYSSVIIEAPKRKKSRKVSITLDDNQA